MRHITVVGTSELQTFQLLEDGGPLNGSTWDVEIAFRTDVVPALTPEQVSGISQVTAAWLDQLTGTVRVSGVEFLPTGKYYFRFEVTGGGKTAYFPVAQPGGAAAEWFVVHV